MTNFIYEVSMGHSFLDTVIFLQVLMNRSLLERGLISRGDYEDSVPQENLELTVTPGRVRRQEDVGSLSTPARGGGASTDEEVYVNNNTGTIGNSGRQPRPRQEERSRRGQPKGNYWEESLDMTKDLRHVQMRVSQLLLEAAELHKEKNRIEVELAKEQRTREEERWSSERR